MHRLSRWMGRSKPSENAGGGKLHIGSGTVKLPGWINIDNQSYRGVDLVHDVTKGLPFHDVSFIFAEHFIEHLEYPAAVRFLSECRRALSDEGVLRLTTPNLDWVWLSQYHYGQWENEGEVVRDCFRINKGFRGWGHRFLYNFSTLRETLTAAGFAHAELRSYGESPHEELRGLEQHELYPDLPGVSHLIVVEAKGKAAASGKLLGEARVEYEAAIEVS